MSNTKTLLSLSILASLVLSLVVVGLSSVTTVDAKKPSPTMKCNNVKVQVRVTGVEENQTVVASATIGASSKSKTGVVEANETSITLPINFKKISPCPGVGAPIFGDVNGTGFQSELKSLKKPNVVKVALP